MAMQDKGMSDLPLPAAPDVSDPALPGPAQPGDAPRSLARRVAGRLRREIDAALRAAQRGGTAVGTASLDRLRRLTLRHPGRMLAPLAAARRLRPASLFLAQAEALATARARGWAAAAPAFARIADPEARPALVGPTAAALLRPADGGPAVALAAPAASRPGFLPADAAAGIVVYTAVLGRPQPLPPLFGIAARLRFVCFTDQPATAPGWQSLPPPAEAGTDPAAATAFLKSAGPKCWPR